MKKLFLFMMMVQLAWFDGFCEESIKVLCNKGAVHCVATFHNKDYGVIVGKNGLSKNKREGDKKTPIGEFGLHDTIFYRGDRIDGNLFQNPDYKFMRINQDSGWCQDSENALYNKFVSFTESCGCRNVARLNRKDHFFDIIMVVNYNTENSVPNKGSGIFIHMKDLGNSGTKGCIRFGKKDLIEIINKITKDTTISIDYR